MTENEKKYCAECGAEIQGEAIEIDGEYYCAECADEWTKCADCGEWIRKDDAMTGADDEYYCESCFYDNFTICEYCGEVIYNDDAVVVARNPYERRHGDNYYYCQDCADNHAYRCDDCGEYFTDDDCIYETRTGAVCSDCADNYYYCNECGYYVNEYDYNCDEGMCDECAAANCNSSLIKSYHSRPRLQLFGECKKQWNNLWRGIGIELEIDRDSHNGTKEKECAETIKEIAGDELYFNRDGSLDNGFEIITQPHTIDAFYNMKWAEILDACKNAGYTSHDAGTCGLHVHFSREYFGATAQKQNIAISKLIRFYDIFWDDVLKVSRRTDEQADRWAARYGTKSRADAEEYGTKKRYAGRYFAVNNTNAATVELRLTRGTLNYSTFLACINFMTTICTNARRIAWRDIDNAEKWLDGIKPETADYIKKQNAFAGVVKCA